MTALLVPGIGKIDFNDVHISVAGAPTRRKYAGVVCAVQRRPRGVILGKLPLPPDVLRPGPHPERWRREWFGQLKGQVDPKLLESEAIWASVSANERVDKGAAIQVNREFGTVGTTSNGVIANIAIANASLTKTHTDLSLGSASASVTTNEYTTIGLSRVLGTVQNYVAASSLNGTFSVDVYNSFSVTGSGTAYGAGLFDSATVSGSYLYCEDNFSSTAVLVNLDTLNVTWTVTN